MIKKNKVISSILAMTIISGLVTPVNAIEVTADDLTEEVFSLENAELEKISDDTDILEEDVSETQEAGNDETESEEEIIDKEDSNKINNTEEFIDENKTEIENDSEQEEEKRFPLYDDIDEEMENYLKDYLQSSKSEVTQEELDKLLKEYLEKNPLEELQQEDLEENEKLSDGTYIVKNSTLKLEQDKDSVLRNYLSDETILEIKNGQKYLTLILDKNISTMSDYQIYVNDYNGGYEIVESSDEIIKLKINIQSLEDEIVFETHITNDYYSENMKCRVILDMDSIEENSTEYKEDSEILSAEEESQLMDIMEAKEAEIEADGYDITVTDNSNNALDSSRLIIKDGRMAVQFTFNNAEALGTVKEVKVNGEIIEKSLSINKDDDKLTVEALINSLNDVIDITFSKSQNNNGWSDTSLNNIHIKDIRLNKGTYSLESTSNANRYISSINLEINDNGKMYLLTTFGMGQFITVTDLHVNNKSESYSTKKYLDGKAMYLSVKSEISSLDDIVNIFVDINLTAMGMGIMSHDMQFTELRLKGVSAPEDETENEEIEDDVSQGSVLEDGEYTIGTSILKTGTQEESMAGSFFDKESSLSVKDGKYNLTLYINSISMMSDIVVKVNGNTVETKRIDNSDGKSGTISFEIPRLNSSIIMYCHVDAGVHVADYDFSISLDKNNIINKNTNEKVEPPVEYEQAELSNNTVYKIINEVKGNTSSETSGLAKYVDTTSVIEVDSSGGIYLTLNFTMSGLMNGRTIRLNNDSSVTTYAVVNSNNTNGIRFKISSLRDKIHISDQYGSSVSDGFTLILKEDTLEKTGTISGNGSGSGNNTDDNTSSSDDDDDDIDDGTYVIKNYCYKEKSDTTSDARGYLDTESVLVVKNGKKHVILKFTHGKMMSDTSIKVEDKKTTHTVVKNSGNKYYIKFKIDSLSDEIMVTSTINTGIPAIGVMKDVKFRVLLRENTLDEDENAADFDDEDEEEIEEIEENEEVSNEETTVEDTNKNESIVMPPANETISSATGTEQYKKLTYKVNNEILTDSKIGYQAARGAVNETSFYEIENGKKYVTLGFSQTDILNNIRLYDNGKEVSYSVVSEDKSKNTMSIRFEILSLSNEITVKTNVTAMGRDISFGLKFLETTLELISTEEFENLSNSIEDSGSTSSSGVMSGLSSTISNLFSGEKNSEVNVEVSEEAAENLSMLAKEYFKKYTVSNEIISDSAIGRSMARKYLNQTSIIEDIDGQLYATITFSSSDSMGDFRIEVNGETAVHTIPLHDRSNNLISLRFPINNVNDDIRVYMYINPMRMTINFGIKFLEDSMILIEEGIIGAEGEDNSSSLADTLSNVNETSSNSSKEQVSAVKIAASTSVMMIVLNQIIAGLGVLFKRVNVKSILKK